MKLKSAPFGFEPMRDLPVAIELFEKFASAASEHPSVETGGVVLFDKRGVLMELLHSGPRARRTRTSYWVDPEFLQGRVDEAAARGFEVGGFWHVHPRGVSEPSATDVRTARDIVGDPEWNLPRLILPLSVRTARGLDTKFYILNSAAAELEPLRVVVVHDTARADAASGGGVHRVALQRLKADRDALARDGWEASLRASSDRGTYVMRLVRGDVVLVVEFPAEYPASPPKICVAERTDAQPIAPGATPEVLAWSSLSSLPQLVAECVASHTPRRSFLRRLLSFRKAPIPKRLELGRGVRA